MDLVNCQILLTHLISGPEINPKATCRQPFTTTALCSRLLARLLIIEITGNCGGLKQGTGRPQKREISWDVCT